MKIEAIHNLVVKMGKTTMTKGLTRVIKNVTTVRNPEILLVIVIERKVI